MEVKGIITRIFETQTGESDKGKWEKHSFLLNSGGQYAKDYYFEWFGKQFDNVIIGSAVDVKFDVSSKEYNGKWYSTLKPYGVYVEGYSSASNKNDVVTLTKDDLEEESSDGLPF